MAKSTGNKKNKKSENKVTLSLKELDKRIKKEAKKLANKIVDKKVEKAVAKALSAVTASITPKTKVSTAKPKAPRVNKTSMDFNAREAMTKIRASLTVNAVNKFASNETRSTVLKVKEAKLKQLTRK